MKKNGFTMIEVVYGIVVLGILAAVAVPKMAATRTDAEITKARSDIASIRSAIVTERQSRLIKGDSSFINQLHSSSTTYFDSNGTAATDGQLLMYAITPENKDGHWKTGASCTSGVCTYIFMLEGVDNNFTYTSATGKFSCVTATAPRCDSLTK